MYILLNHYYTCSSIFPNVSPKPYYIKDISNKIQ